MFRPATIYIFLLLALSSCEGDIFLNYRWTGMKAVHADNSMAEPAPTSQTTLPALNYVLRLDLPYVETSRSKGRYFDTESAPVNDNPVDSVSITSTVDFNATYASGSRLNDLFVLYSGSYLKTAPVDAFNKVTNIYNTDYSKKPVPDHADLLLMHAPDSSRAFRFRVYLHFRDQTSFVDTTGSIILHP